MSYSEFVNSRNQDSPDIDAFGRQRVSLITTLFDSKMIYDNQPLIWDDQQVSGGGTTSTYNTNKASVTLAVSANTAGRRIRQTKEVFVYRPGKSQSSIIMTMNLNGSISGVNKRVGQFNDQNGIYFCLSSDTQAYMCIRSYTGGSSGDYSIAQSNWNLDKMDGTGISKINLDFTKTQILMLDYEWLGVGRIRYGWNVNGKIYYCHETNNANNATNVYMSTPTLPLRYEIQHTGTGLSASIDQICSSVRSEDGGSFNEYGRMQSIDRTTVLSTDNSTTLFPVITMRKQSGKEGNINIDGFSIICVSTANFIVKILHNPTLTGTAISYTAKSNSIIEYSNTSTSASSIVSGQEGYEIYSQVVAANTDSIVGQITPTKIPVGKYIDGASDIIVLAVSRLSGNSEDFYATLRWNEVT